MNFSQVFLSLDSSFVSFLYIPTFNDRISFQISTRNRSLTIATAVSQTYNGNLDGLYGESEAFKNLASINRLYKRMPKYFPPAKYG